MPNPGKELVTLAGTGTDKGRCHWSVYFCLHEHWDIDQVHHIFGVFFGNISGTGQLRAFVLQHSYYNVAS